MVTGEMYLSIRVTTPVYPITICTIPEIIIAPEMVRIVRSKRSLSSAIAWSSELKITPKVAGK
jgi:hypothetical protein